MRYTLQTDAGTNLYAWCGNNPVNMVDPMGTFSIKDFLRRGAQTVRSIASGIGAGYYGSQSGGGDGAYAFGYRIGSRARADKKIVAHAEVVKVPAKQKGPSASKPSDLGLISTLTSKIPSPIMQLFSRRDLPKPEYYSGAKAAAQSVYDRYASDNGKSDSCVNAATEASSAVFRPMAAASFYNDTADFVNGYSSASNYATQAGATIGGLCWWPLDAYSVSSSGLSCAQDQGLLDPINEPLSKGMSSLANPQWGP